MSYEVVISVSNDFMRFPSFTWYDCCFEKILGNATSPFQDVWDKSLFKLKCNQKNKKFPIFTFTPYPNIYTALCM